MSQNYFIYHVNREGEIINVNECWLEFARENDFATSQKELAGHSLWEFISGDATKNLYKVLIERVLQAQEAISIPFRCDSANCRRYMTMELSPVDQNTVQFKNRIDKLELRENVELLNPDSPRSKEIIYMCSWCKKVKNEQLVWKEVEEVINEMKLMSRKELPQISHGICEPCETKLSATFKTQEN